MYENCIRVVLLGTRVKLDDFINLNYIMQIWINFFNYAAGEQAGEEMLKILDEAGITEGTIGLKIKK